MDSLPHVIWAAAVAIVAISAARAVVVWLGLVRRRVELAAEQSAAVAALSKRFDEVQAVASALKVEWLNVKLSQGRK